MLTISRKIKLPSSFFFLWGKVSLSLSMFAFNNREFSHLTHYEVCLKFYCMEQGSRCQFYFSLMNVCAYSLYPILRRGSLPRSHSWVQNLEWFVHFQVESIDLF